MSDMTLVNGEDAKDGAVQIGQQSTASDVPIAEYQYVPVDMEKDPSYTVVINPQDLSDEELRIRQLSDIQRSISENGVNYDTVVALEEICPGIIMRNFPTAGFSSGLSDQSLQITMERIDGAKLGGLVAAILVIIGGIFALFSKIKASIGKSKNNAPEAESLKELQTRNEEEVPNIQQQASITEAEIRRNHDAKKWLLENGLVDIIQMHARLSPTINAEAAVNDIGSYLKQVGYADPSRNVLFNLDNVIGSAMPNLFYKNDLARELMKYEALLDVMPDAIKRRIDATGAILDAMGQLKYGHPLTYSPKQDIIIKAVAQFTGSNGYNSEMEALQDLSNIVRQDWEIQDRAKEVSRGAIATIINRSVSPTINAIINSQEKIEKTYERLDRIRKSDMERHMKLMAHTRQEAQARLQNPHLTEASRVSLNSALVELEKAPELIKNEFALVAKLATLSMTPIINASRATNAMNTRIRMYNQLLDRLVSILNRFEKQFGEDIK